MQSELVQETKKALPELTRETKNALPELAQETTKGLPELAQERQDRKDQYRTDWVRSH